MALPWHEFTTEDGALILDVCEIIGFHVVRPGWTKLILPGGMTFVVKGHIADLRDTVQTAVEEFVKENEDSDDEENDEPWRG